MLIAVTVNTVGAASGVFVGREATITSKDGLNVRTDPSPSAEVLTVADGGDFVAVLEGPLFENGDEWYRVDYDGTIGWVSGSFLGPPRDRGVVSTRGNRGEVEANRVRLPVPYYSQLDGSAYQSGNCGPATMRMVFAAFGIDVPVQEMRRAANRVQGTTGIYDAGVGIDLLAQFASDRGLVVRGLRSGSGYDRWTFDEVRQALRNGNIVVPQVHLKTLPGHWASSAAVDHYIAITGYEGDRFFYNDSAFVGTIGYGMSISEEALALAWKRSDYPFAAFSVGPGPGMEPLIAPPPAPRRAEPVDAGPPLIDEAIAAVRLDDKAPEPPVLVAQVPAPLPVPPVVPAPPVDEGVLATAPPAVQVFADAVAATYDATVTVGVEHVSSGVEQITHTPNGPELWTTLGLAGLLAGLGARRQMARLPIWAALRALRSTAGPVRSGAKRLPGLRTESAAA